jgi:hypothetical protein
VQAAVVQPAHFTVERLDALEVRCEEPLAVEELDTFDETRLV